MLSGKELLQHPMVAKRSSYQSLVENRHQFSFCHSELNLFETRQQAEKVSLYFEHPVLAIMLQGRKHMHLPDTNFSFLPGESVIMEASSTMVIDFPEAEMEKPTSCLALEISNDLIATTLTHLNERAPRAEDHQVWQLEKPHYHLLNSEEIYGATKRLFDLYSKPADFNNQLEYLTLQELVLRILQTQARSFLLEDAKQANPNLRLGTALAYIDAHIHEEITIEELCSVACMSKPNFFRCFKAEVGVPPVVYIHQRKIQFACQELAKPHKSISEVGYSLGFSNLGYFSRVFKKLTGLSPVAWKSQKLGKTF